MKNKKVRHMRSDRIKAFKTSLEEKLKIMKGVSIITVIVQKFIYIFILE